MADDKSDIEKTSGKLSVFKNIINETSDEVARLIPTLNTFFGAFKGAQLAGAVRQMADFYQGFKNLSYQMGKSNAQSMNFLKGIYQVKAATGDTINNLNEISTILIKHRVLGEKTLPYLTKQTSFFSEITGASSSTTAQLVGNLSRMGRIGEKSINSILVSMVKVQRTFGMTTEEVEDLSEHIQETTAFLNNMGKSSLFIERFEKGTVKLAAAFASVGLEVRNATSLVDRLLDPSNIEENALLYAKLGISIQDAVMGEIDPGILEGKLKELSQTVAGMSRPVGAAFARQLGINYGELLKYQNMDSSKATTEEQGGDLETMAKEQRALWTRIERFFSSGLGRAASLFLEHPIIFGGLVVGAFLTFGARIMASVKKRFGALADDLGKKTGEAAAKAAEQGLNKSEVIKDLKKNQGLKPGDRQKVGWSAMGYMNASEEKVKSFYGNEGFVRYEQTLNKQMTGKAEYENTIKELTGKYNSYSERLKYLESTNQRGNEQGWLKRQMGALESMIDYTNKAATAAAQRSDAAIEKALQSMTVEERTMKMAELKAAQETALSQANTLQPEMDSLKQMIDVSKSALEKAMEPGSETAKDISSLREQIKSLTAEYEDANKKLEGFKTAADEAGKTLEQVRQSGDYRLANGTAFDQNRFNNFDTAGMQQKHSFWYERLWVSTKRIGADVGRHVAAPFQALGTKFSSLRQSLAGMAHYAKADPVGATFKVFGAVFKGVGSLLKGLMKMIAPMGLAMAGIMIISKIMERFQPLFDMMMPMIESIFDLLATIIAPVMKILIKVGITIIGGIYNAILGIYNWFRRKLHLEEVPNKLGNISETLKKVDAWDVGKNMDEGVKTRPADNEGGVILNSDGSNFQVANLEETGKYFTHNGMGNDMQKLIEEMRKLNGTTNIVLDKMHKSQEEKKKEAQAAADARQLDDARRSISPNNMIRGYYVPIPG